VRPKLPFGGEFPAFSASPGGIHDSDATLPETVEVAQHSASASLKEDELDPAGLERVELPTLAAIAGWIAAIACNSRGQLSWVRSTQSRYSGVTVPVT